jgi:hypothetical protein
LSSQDVPQRLVISVLDIQHKGKYFASADGMADKLSVDGNRRRDYFPEASRWFSRTASQWNHAFRRRFTAQRRSDCDRMFLSSNSRLAGWFSAACFSAPADLFGNEPALTRAFVLRIANFDFAFKRTRFAGNERFGLDSAPSSSTCLTNSVRRPNTVCCSANNQISAW